MLKHPSILIAFMTIACVGVLIFFTHPLRHGQTIRCYFHDAQGLKTGAAVRLAGVDVGRVVSVRARPEHHDAAAEVTMVVQTDYNLAIPSDAIVTLESPGILDSVVAEIDVRNAVGNPLRPDGVLQTRESHHADGAELMDCFAKLTEHKHCPLLDTKQDEPANPTR